MSELELSALYVSAVELSADDERLLLVNRDPGPGEIGVSIDAALALELVDSDAADIDRGTVRVWVDDELAFDGRATPEVTPAFAGPLVDVVSSSDTLRIVLHPVMPFASEALVTVRVVARTLDDAASIDAVYAFAIEDRTAPRVVAAQAIGQRLVRIAFNEPVHLPDGAQFVFAPKSFPAVSADVESVTTEENVVTLSLDREMTPDVEYEVVARGVTDLSGNEVLGPYDRTSFAGFRPPQPLARRFSLWEMIQKHNRRDDVTRDLWRFIACLQEVADLLLVDVDRWVDIFDLERAPPPFLDLILRDLGNPFAFELDTMGKRRLASVLVELYEQKGTAKGIQNAVRFFLGIELATIMAWAEDTLTLGESELGVDWVLGPSGIFARYAFSIEVGRVLAENERKLLRVIVEYMKPAHTHFMDLLEPVLPAEPDHWELGISEIGFSTILH